MALMTVGLVGCGNIATELGTALCNGGIPAVVRAVSDIEPARAEALKTAFAPDAVVCSVAESAAQVDFLVECATAEVVPSVLDAAIRHRRDCLILSVGALLSQPELMERAQTAGIRVRMPSGAICGLDGIRAAKEAGLTSVTLTTRKPVKGLEGAPYLVANNVDLSALREPTVVFEGPARDAVKAFPKNVNVAAALSLVGIGPDKTMVRIVADPDGSVNSHEIVVEGAFGKLRTVTENVPSPRNVKTSFLAALSAVSEVRQAAMEFAAKSR